MALENSIESIRLRNGAARRTAGRSWFYVAMGAVAVGIVVIGFVPGLAFSPTKRNGPPTTDILLHSLVAAMWLALFITQAVLVRGGNTRIHRRLGWIGIPLAIAVVASGFATTIAQGRRGFALWWDPDLKFDSLAELVHPLGDLLHIQPAGHRCPDLEATVGCSQAAHAPRGRRIPDGRAAGASNQLLSDIAGRAAGDSSAVGGVVLLERHP